MARDVVVYLLWVVVLVVEVRFAIRNLRARNDWSATASIVAAGLAWFMVVRAVS